MAYALPKGLTDTNQPNWWANWLECISFLSYDNRVIVGGIKVQLE